MNDDKKYWGNTCERHKNVGAWVARVKRDKEGLHCFGCFIESRERDAISKHTREYDYWPLFAGVVLGMALSVTTFLFHRWMQ